MKGEMRMSNETKLEVIKALAYGESVKDVADFADVDVEEILQIQDECAAEIEERRKEIDHEADE